MDHHRLGHGIRELDLSACHPKAFNDTMGVVPGLKTSTAFFTFLRANLVLSPSAMSSCANTPVWEPTTVDRRPLSSPSPLAVTEPLVPEDDIPELSLEPLETSEDKVEGLHLVADSIAEMQQRAGRALVSHPACLAGLGAALAVVYKTAPEGMAVLVGCGVVMSYLLAIRHVTSGYVRLAEDMDWNSWISPPDHGGEQDIILGARYNQTLIGAVILRLESNKAAKRPSSKARCLRGGRGVIRAWTTKLKYRGTGLGRDLLFEAVRVTKEKCGKDAEVGFAKEHANSVMLLPKAFNNRFRRDEIRATKALDKALGDWEVSKKKR